MRMLYERGREVADQGAIRPWNLLSTPCNVSSGIAVGPRTISALTLRGADVRPLCTAERVMAYSRERRRWH